MIPTITPSHLYQYDRQPLWIWYELFGDASYKEPISDFAMKLLEDGVTHEEQIIPVLKNKLINKKMTHDISSYVTTENDMKGRKAADIKGLDDHDFDKLAKQAKHPRERRRFLAFAHIKEGVSFTSAAKMMRVTPRTVIGWVTAFREKGLDGLREKPGRGAKPHVPYDKQEEFKEAVVKLQKQREGGRIRGEDVRVLIQEKFGKLPCKSGVYNSLKRAGLVWITGRSQHPKADKEAQEEFKKKSE